MFPSTHGRRVQPPAREPRALLTIAALLLALSAQAAERTTAPAAEPTVDFTVAPTDTLTSLGVNVLASPDAWHEVAALNRLRNPDRIVPGQVLKIPTRLLRVDARDARVVSVFGDVRIGTQAVADGAVVHEGQSLSTGPGSSAVIEIGDGSHVRLPPSSLAQVKESRLLGARADNAVATASTTASSGATPPPPDGWFVGTLRVLRGSVEVLATKVLRAKPLEVVTPTAVVGVRGTNYRVALDPEANNRTRGEVVEGLVRFDAAGNAGGADVAAGFAGVADASGAKPGVVKLPPAPDLSGVPARFDRPLVRFALPGETSALRVQVASDAAFDKIVSDQRVEPGAEVRIADLEDAQWHLRARRIDAQGVEGFDATRTFMLKARPQPPVYRTPRANSKQQVGEIEFAWVMNADTPMVQVQVAEDEAFTKIVAERDELTDTRIRFTLKTAGVYFWRLASVRASGDHGPFGDPQRFELRPDAPPPSAGHSADGKGLTFEWSGRPQDKQQVELASDPDFKQVVEKAELTAPSWAVTPPGGGRYYFRYRSVEPDGYVGPFSDKLVIDVPRDWTPLLLLVPLLVFAF
jgi:hypothetical protein